MQSGSLQPPGTSLKDTHREKHALHYTQRCILPSVLLNEPKRLIKTNEGGEPPSSQLSMSGAGGKKLAIAVAHLLFLIGKVSG